MEICSNGLSYDSIDIEQHVLHSLKKAFAKIVKNQCTATALYKKVLNFI